MPIGRVVPNLTSTSLDDAAAFYGSVLGFEVVMSHGWIITMADAERRQVQLNLISHDETAPVVPEVSIEVDDVEDAYEAALSAGAEIVYELTEEPWGVRRFFVRDPDGHVINILAHG